VLDAWITSITLGIGGSATSDGGAGLLQALVATIDPTHVAIDRIDPRLGGVDLRIACDVTNPLLGPRGAAATYGPQKGATPQDVEVLDAALARFADHLRAQTARDERETPGAGAAGGTAFGLLSIADRFQSIRLVPGIEVVMEETGLAEKLAGADLVLTGEGRIDAQTAFGKTALGVAQRARAAGVACIAIGGGIDSAGEAVLWELGAITVGVAEAPMSLEAAMAAGTAPVERCGRRLGRLVSAGRTLGG